MKFFEMKVGDTVVRAELLTDKAPRICRAFEKSLPAKSFGVNAKFAGEETIVMVPFYTEPENEVGSVSPGDIGYYPTRQTLCLFYGKIMPFASVSLFARVVPQDLKKAQAAGRDILKTGALPVTLSLVGGRKRPTAQRRRKASPYNAVALLEKALEDVWADEPADVKRLRRFKRPPMGNLPCVFYANFDLFWATENLLATRPLVEKRLTAAQSGAVVATLLRRTRSRVAHWGFEDTSAVLDKVAKQVEKARSRKEVVSTIEAAVLYIDRVQNWVDAMLPWNDLDETLKLLR